MAKKFKEKKNVCCICGCEYKGDGNNARPYEEGQCCDKCNEAYVIPYRLMLMFAEREKDMNSYKKCI